MSLRALYTLLTLLSAGILQEVTCKDRHTKLATHFPKDCHSDIIRERILTSCIYKRADGGQSHHSPVAATDHEQRTTNTEEDSWIDDLLWPDAKRLASDHYARLTHNVGSGSKEMQTIAGADSGSNLASHGSHQFKPGQQGGVKLTQMSRDSFSLRTERKLRNTIIRCCIAHCNDEDFNSFCPELD